MSSMTKEEAATMIETMISWYAFNGREAEALGMGVEALRPITREQVEKMRGKWIDARYSSKDVPKCQCSICGKKYIGLETDFCQYCGAPMTDKAVDMVMERINEMEGMKK